MPFIRNWYFSCDNSLLCANHKTYHIIFLKFLEILKFVLERISHQFTHASSQSLLLKILYYTFSNAKVLKCYHCNFFATCLLSDTDLSIHLSFKNTPSNVIELYCRLTQICRAIVTLLDTVRILEQTCLFKNAV